MIKNTPKRMNQQQLTIIQEKKKTEALLEQAAHPSTKGRYSRVLIVRSRNQLRALGRLEKEELIYLQSTGTGKTSTYTIHLNWKSALAEKTVALALAQEAEIQKRWTFVFAEMEAEAEFVILFGSILPSPKTAADIDIITVAKQAKVLAISRLLEKIQQTQEKNIHAQNFTLQEFKKELHQKNKIFLDALHRGVILFGQEKFLQFIRRLA